MNSFEFIMVLVSIIIGLGIAELLKTLSIKDVQRGQELSLACFEKKLKNC